MLKDDALLLIPNVLKVFLENGQIKSFTFDTRTTVKDVMVTLQDRLSLRYIEHFALVLEPEVPDQNHKLLLLQDRQPLTHVVQRTQFLGMKCLFRVSFFPKDPAELLRRDPAAFEYLYIQSRNDVIKERFGTDLKPELMLRLAALHIYITVSVARPSPKISLKHVEKEWGLEPFLPASLLQSVKEKNIRKSLSQQLKAHQNHSPTTTKVSAAQAKLQYLRILNEIPTFGGVLFNTVGVEGKQSSTTLLVGPRHGISHVIDLKTNLTTVLVEFSRIHKVQLFRESPGVARVETHILEAKPLILLMEWAEALNFATLIAGYYRLFVDHKKTIFCRTPNQPHLIKTDYLNLQNIQRASAKTGQAEKRESRFHSNSSSAANSVNAGPKDNGQRSASPEESELVSFCYLHMREERQQHDNQMDVNENLIFFEETRPRTKSDPTSRSSVRDCKSAVQGYALDGLTKERLLSRARANTMDGQTKGGQMFFYCDSCKAKIKNNLAAKVDILKKCTNACSSRENMVDLMSLPPPGSDEEEEVEDESRALLPAITVPPPGFRDNSSDEDDTKRRAAQGQEPGRHLCGIICDEIPVTLIDSVQTRTVRDHAQELDDALVSTLQALEALAASEDGPHSQPQQTTGLIVLAAITPESSMDSGHETNSSELTDISEMVTAMKQQQNTTYLLAHHIDKEGILGKKDLPFRIQTCSTQAIIGGAYRVGQKEVTDSPKSSTHHQYPKASVARVKHEQQEKTGVMYNLQLNIPISAHHPDQGGKSSSSPKSDQNSFSDAKDKKESSSSSPVSTLCSELLKSPDRNMQPEDNVSSPASAKEIPSLTHAPTAVSASIYDNNVAISEDLKTRSLPIKMPSAENIKNVDRECSTSINKHAGPKGKVEHVENTSICSPQKNEVPKQQDHLQTHDADVFHCSPTEDERVHIKDGSEKNIQPKSSKEGLCLKVTAPLSQKPVANSSSISSKSPEGKKPHCESSIKKSKPEEKFQASPSTINISQKNTSDPQKTQKPSVLKPDSTAVAIPVPGPPTENMLDVKDSGLPTKPKAQKAPFKLKNLFSATFPTRLKKETDERQVQLQKVKQYEMEFLEELLKPKAKVELPPKDFLHHPVPGHCPCQVRSSPLQKVPGISREQRRSCDCKRVCRGLRLQPSSAGPQMERQGRDREAHRIAVENRVSSVDVNVKNARIRSTSLESRDNKSDPERSVSCLATCTSRGECMRAPHYRKLMRRYSGSEIDKSDLASLSSEGYQNVNAVKLKSLKKEPESIVQDSTTTVAATTTSTHLRKGQGTELTTDPPFVQADDDKKIQKSPTIYSIHRDVYPARVTEIPKEETDNEKCCSIRYCFYYRKCDAEDNASDKDELSYSIPMQILPGMQLDDQTVPVVSKTLQVLDATACSTPDNSQSQEIDLRTSSFEGCLSRINALRGRGYTLPEGFLTAQLDANELLTILRQCVVTTEARDPKVYVSKLAEYKQDLALKFKEFRASCRRVAAVDKSPSHMLSAITGSFQVLCSLIETFVRLVYIVRSETQRQELLGKVEEVIVNYTFLLRAAEESMSRILGHTVGNGAQQSAAVSTVMSTFTRSIKTLMNK
ncbi:FERM and PDZ domain-containing protein 3 [Protopterus annectens]|uniref:FERM and PDZ domain-containing protein 3 n=1 Tax=Protopterus annectens TaxID=7888 RepID=UPI001CFB397C|nr:FERM and PDZ domain-containing protein 3 [Protopterus annectens]